MLQIWGAHLAWEKAEHSEDHFGSSYLQPITMSVIDDADRRRRTTKKSMTGRVEGLPGPSSQAAAHILLSSKFLRLDLAPPVELPNIIALLASEDDARSDVR